MMKYLVILLSDQSTSFCYYNSSNNIEENKLIPLDTLQNAIKYAFMENLFIQFVLPSFPLPKEYEEIITSTKASIIAPASTTHNADVLVIEGFSEFNDTNIKNKANYVLRTNKDEFFKRYKDITRRLIDFNRLNIVFKDVENFTAHNFELYKKVLNDFVLYAKDIILSGKTIQLNILTDRLVKDEMNNCNAGNNTITIAPDGKFYICPAFYYAKEQAIGN